MIQKIIRQLSNKKLSAWQIRWARKKSHQSFLARETKECRRTVETETCVISIHQKHGDTLGLSSFKISPADLGELDKKLDEALFAANLAHNQPFKLPEQPKKLPIVSLYDKSLDGSTLQECEERILKAVAKEKRTRLSSAEFFIDQIESRLVNHRGLDVSQKETLLHAEFILLATSGALARRGGRENEYIGRYTHRTREDFDLEGEIKQSAQFARDATAATLPRTGTFPVLFSEEPLDQLFNPLIARASARLKYNKMMQMNIGQSVVEEGKIKGDAVTLWSNGLIKEAVGSTRFDSYGTPSSRICLIEDNKLKTYLADKRYADYLGVPVTGELGNIEVKPGSTPFGQLKDPGKRGEKTIYHLQAFSAFEPNAITGAFSAEIRAGYEITAKGARPIKGGSVSGVLQRDLLDCHFSKEQTQRERILAPRGVLFSKLTLAGA